MEESLAYIIVSASSSVLRVEAWLKPENLVECSLRLAARNCRRSQIVWVSSISFPSLKQISEE